MSASPHKECTEIARVQLASGDPDTTRDIAARLGQLLRAGDVVALYGELGTGKTCFVQGLAKGLGIRDNVTSPTFILMRRHNADPPLCHTDAYRLESGAELEDIGFSDMIEDCVVAIEWADRVAEALPEARVEVRLSFEDDDARRIEIVGKGERQAKLVREAFE